MSEPTIATDPPRARPRRLTRWLGWVPSQIAFLVVVAALIAAFVLLAVDPGQWRPATLVIAAALLGAALFRLVLPAAVAGMLAVRRRWWDVVCYLAMGAVLLTVDIRLR